MSIFKTKRVAKMNMNKTKYIDFLWLNSKDECSHDIKVMDSE